MGSQFLSPLKVPKRAAAAAGAALTLLAIAGAGTFWNFTKETPNGASAARNIQCWSTSSGGTRACIRENGDIVASGSLITHGVTVSTGATLTTCTNGASIQKILAVTGATAYDAKCTFPANTLQVGDKYRVTLTGSGAETTDIARYVYQSLQMTLGGQDVIPSSVPNITDLYLLTSAEAGPNYWIAEGIFSVRSVGASGTVVGSTSLLVSAGSIGTSDHAVTVKTTAVDTTSDLDLEVEMWSTGSGSDIYQNLIDFTVEKLPQ